MTALNRALRRLFDLSMAKERSVFSNLKGACFESPPHELLRSGSKIFSMLPLSPHFIQLNKWRLRYILHRELDPFHDDKCGVLFIHIPKNAGNSFFEALHGHYPATHHFTAQFYQLINPAKFEKAIKVAVIRDPDERFISAINYNKYLSKDPYDQQIAERYLNYDAYDEVCISADREDSFYQALCEHTHFRRQVGYVCDANGKIIVDLLISMRALAAGLKEIDRVTGCKSKLVHRNASKKVRSSFQLSGRMREFYEADYQLWEMTSQSDSGFIWFNEK